MKLDLTVLAIPGFIGAMGAEYTWHARNSGKGTVACGVDTSAGEYQLADTLASLTMGIGSLVAPLVTDRLLAGVRPGVGGYAKVAMGLSLAGAAVATAGDVIRRSRTTGLPRAGEVSWSGRAAAPALERFTGGAAVTALASTVVTVSTLWSARTASSALFRRSPFDLGAGALANAVAIVG